jgi:hypothetical protein
MKRALIIGSQVAGLTGVHNDIAAIRPRLESRGFELDVRTKDAASREGILAGLRRLITDSGEQDAAVIYYSGHGARVHNPRHLPGTRNEPQLLHCLVPTDWFEPGFRGLLGVELSQQLAELTAKTKNVAVILDCCHSARMWKGADSQAVARALDRIRVAGVGEHLELLEQREREGEFDLSKLHAESNPDAVRLVAAEADRSAYELPLEFAGKHQSMGIMTAMLSEVLDELGKARISWRTLAMLVRERVMQRYDYQRPELEGPGQRYLFEIASAKLDGGVVYYEDSGRPALRTCRLLGAEVGARYALMQPGCSEYDSSKTVAEAVITDFVAAGAHVRLEPRDDTVAPSVGTLAFLLEGPLGKRGVRVRGEGPNAEAMSEAIAASRYVTVASAAKQDRAVAFVEVEVGDELTLLGDNGHALAYSERNNATGRGRIVRELERWARAETLRELGDGELRSRWEFEWGRVVDGQKIPMTDGDMVHSGDGIYIEFINQSKRPLLFTAFDIGVDGAITLLTGAEPSGTKVEPGQSYVLGLELGDTGLLVSWPENVPDAVPLPESLMLIVSEARHDFTALETRGARATARGLSTPLEHILDQIGRGGTRNVGSQRQGESAKYAVARVDFVTTAQPRVPFAVEQPVGRLLLEQALDQPVAQQPQRELAIRLNELLVHDNRKLWGSTDIRIDTLCVTGDQEVSTSTHVFGHIADEDRVPFDNLLVFKGPVTGFVDFAIWVSKHDDGQADLPELMREVANEAEFQHAVTVLGGLALAGPQAASLAAGLAAGGTVTYFVSRLIQRALGQHIGLYRCSFLPQEEWGIGRHPKSDMLRAQDFSFSFEILPV